MRLFSSESIVFKDKTIFEYKNEKPSHCWFGLKLCSRKYKDYLDPFAGAFYALEKKLPFETLPTFAFAVSENYDLSGSDVPEALVDNLK